jgi:uncharacterized membrane protein YfcA
MILIIAAFLISALMGMGVGGGGLFIIYLTQCLSFDQMTSQGTNLIFFILAGVFSLIYHIGKRKLYPLQLIIMIAFGMLGSYIFSHLANALDPTIPKIALGVLLTFSGAYSLVNIFINRKNN